MKSSATVNPGALCPQGRWQHCQLYSSAAPSAASTGGQQPRSTRLFCPEAIKARKQAQERRASWERMLIHNQRLCRPPDERWGLSTWLRIVCAPIILIKPHIFNYEATETLKMGDEVEIISDFTYPLICP